MSSRPYSVLHSLAELREIYAEPNDFVKGKKAARIEPPARAFIEACPFVLLATCDADGRCDVSPRGGDPGFVHVLDERTLLLPDLGGNNLLDSLQNVIANPHAGLLFVMPGRDETLRTDGAAWITTEPALLDRFTEVRRPKSALLLEVEAIFIHCAKSFRRAQLWAPSSWAALPEAPTAVAILRDQLAIPASLDELTADVERSYATELAEERKPR